MQKLLSRGVVSVLLFLVTNAYATVRYVSLSSPNPTPPYLDWSTAATNIQDAIDASTNGDTVLVTNGVYDTGATAMTPGSASNRIVLNNALTVQSVNGPAVTTIQGFYTNNALTQVRCAWLTNNAALIGFTLTGGASYNGGDNGGGVWCASSNSLVENCVIVSNIASSEGSAVYQGTCDNCLMSSNNGFNTSVSVVYNTSLNSCTVVSNSNFALFQGSITNCIIYYNRNFSSSVKAAYSCAPTLLSGPGNLTNAPQLFADGVHLLSTSPCIGAGTNVVTGTDVFGNAWANPPSIGCAEYTPAPVVSQPSLRFVPFAYSVNAAAAGTPAPSVSWLLNGVPLQDGGPLSFTQTTNLIAASVSVAQAGNYQLVASNAFGAVTSAAVALNIHCVSTAGLNPLPPYLTWDTAATNIQDAINAAGSGDLVLVTNGIYQYGVQSTDGVTSNRVTLNKPLVVMSANGPFVTTILGGGATNGASAIRCAWLTNNATLVGFTLEAGATKTGGGGGVWCAASNCFVQNCIIASNTALGVGTAVYQGTLNNCLINTNLYSVAVFNAMLNNCTVVSNAGGLNLCTITNCIVYGNGTYNSVETTGAYSCTTPALSGPGNITNGPQFFADGVHLLSSSACIHAGTNLTIGPDIFGLAWNNPPSMGCAEFNPIPAPVAPQITLGPNGFSIASAVNGEPPFAFQWLFNGVPVQNGGGFSSAQATNLVASGLSFADAGSYQLVASNAFGVVTSAPVQLTIHLVDAAGTNPQPPFLTWATAATNIQDAIEAAAAGDIVLVTNGIYEFGGRVMDGFSSNRVALDKALEVCSVNGWAYTAIQGAQVPVSTNGPNAVRCAWLTNGAVLCGFTLQNGATQNTGSQAAESGGGAYCASTNTSLVFNCVLSNNCAFYEGGGIANGVANNSLIVNNTAKAMGGGAAYSVLNNCTVENNAATGEEGGGGTFFATVRNSIVTGNLNYYFVTMMDNYEPLNQILYSYTCTKDSLGNPPYGTGNISSDPEILDLYGRISINSPCRGAGSPLYATGVDGFNEPWNNPPSMGWDEVVPTNRVGPLSVTSLTVSQSIVPTSTNVLVNHQASFVARFTGVASYFSWNFGDGPSITNVGLSSSHQWANPGSYNAVFTVYNADHPAGVSSNIVMQVLPIIAPQMQPPIITSNGQIQFQFTAQTNGFYFVQYATNLTPPVTWQTLEDIFPSFTGLVQISDSPPTNSARFYRVEAQ